MSTPRRSGAFSIPLAILLLCGAAAHAQTPSGSHVWAIGESMRIDPISGVAFEDKPLLFPDCLTGNYREANLIWNSKRRRISLHAARNETIAFQLVVERPAGGKLSGAAVSIGELTGPGGAKIPRENVELFKEWYVHVTKRSRQNYSLGTGWYPDGLLPCLRWKGNLYPHTYVHPFEIPDLMNGIGDKQRNQALWIDIYIPGDRSAAPPGTYTGEISVSSSAGRVDLSLELKVWDFALPEESHINGNIHTDTEINTFPDDMELRYYQMMRKHRLAMGVLGYTPDLKVTGTDVEIDWRRYDARLAKYLDGSAFTQKHGYSGPGYGQPLEFLVMPFDAFPINLYKQSIGMRIGKEFKFYGPWPVAVPEGGPDERYAEIWKKTFRLVESHLDSRPEWRKTRLVTFLLSLDEAYDEAARERMFYYGWLLKESGAKRLEYRVDGWYPRETMLRLAKVLRIAILGLGGWEPDVVEEIRKEGVDPWFYTLAAWTDGDSLTGRGMGWIAWKYRAGSWTLWELDFNSLRAWMYPETYPDTNGHGMLIYRGETMGLEEPAGSMRLKYLRRGSQDYEYFWLLSQSEGGRKQADAAVDSIVSDFVRLETEVEPLGAAGMWKHNPDEWDRERIRLGDAIEKLAAGR
ncbi:MAG: DUF4091 domain-containing protein [Bryobacteraceae bacterium]|nr:DUF4091 domain-containing protein [Bryobacteraceae bacterium]